MKGSASIQIATAFLLCLAATQAEAQKTVLSMDGIRSGAQIMFGASEKWRKPPGIPPRQAGPGIEAEDLRGKPVLDKQGQKVATVKGLVKDPGKPAEKIVLTVGSDFSVYGKDVQVPVEVFFFDNDGELAVAMSREELAQLPPATSN